MLMVGEGKKYSSRCCDDSSGDVGSCCGEAATLEV
jgi:hypothetical protein